MSDISIRPYTRVELKPTVVIVQHDRIICLGLAANHQLLLHLIINIVVHSRGDDPRPETISVLRRGTADREQSMKTVFGDITPVPIPPGLILDVETRLNIGDRGQGSKHPSHWVRPCVKKRGFNR